jgi:hypothetical protein
MVCACVCEVCEGGRTSWELLVMLLVCECDDENCPLTCDGGGEERWSSVASSSSSSRAVMRRLVIGRLTTVRGRERCFG